MLFADRIISWFSNPNMVTATNGTALPLAFNSVYHIGADLALLVIIPAAIIQYVLTSPIYALVHNRAVNLKVSEKQKIDLFLNASYRKIMITSVAVSAAGAVLLNIIAPSIITEYFGGSQTSINIMTFASIGAIFLSAFAANGIFLMFFGRSKNLAIIALISALIVSIGGTILAQYGFENIIYAYVASMVFAAAASTVVMQKTMKQASSWLFARYL
jgi:O-antigen/teichoic acid export membrane protein